MFNDEIFQVLDALEASQVRYWVGGGVGVAALIGHTSRTHRDLDLAVDARDLEACRAVLQSLGYAPETDWLPVRLELSAPGDRWVDLHPIVFAGDAEGRQEGLNGTWFDYPPEGFTMGMIDGRPVPCLSEAQQRRFHAGYEPRPQDIHDLALLDGLASGRS